MGPGVGALRGSGGTTGTGGMMTPFGSSRMGGMFGSPFGMSGGMSPMGDVRHGDVQRDEQSAAAVADAAEPGGGDCNEVAPVFVAAARTPAAYESRVQQRMANNPQVRSMGSVSVTLERKTAVLQGSVRSEHDRQVLGKMLLLEPGIAGVRNELLVGVPVPPKAQP